MIIYVIVISVCLLDMKGKLLYFEEDSGTEYNFETAIDAIANNPSWKMKTDDQGYFQRAFSYNDEYWSEYNVFISILLIGSIAALTLIIAAIIDITKLIKLRWDMRIYVVY